MGFSSGTGEIVKVFERRSITLEIAVLTLFVGSLLIFPYIAISKHMELTYRLCIPKISLVYSARTCFTVSSRFSSGNLTGYSLTHLPPRRPRRRRYINNP
jgi:hypothetical protein